MKVLIATLSVLLVTGCSLFQPSPRKLVLTEEWSRQPYKGLYLAGQLAHQMSPVIYEDLVIVGNSVEGITTYNRHTGQEQWRLKIENGTSSTGAVVGDDLYIGGSDGQFYSIQVYTGKINWTFPTRMENIAPPLVYNGMVYFISGNDVVYALDAQTGRQRWIYTRTLATELSIRGGPRPVVNDNSLILGFSDGFLVSLNHKDGSLQWERQLNSNIRFKDVDSTAVIDGDMMYVSAYDQSLYALSKKDGQIVWRYDEGGSYPVSILGDRLFLATGSNKLVALNKKTGALIWEKNIEHGNATQPVLFRNYLVYGESQGALRVVQTDDGKEIAHFFTGRGMLASPSVDVEKGQIFTITNQGNLFGFSLKWKSLVELNSKMGI